MKPRRSANRGSRAGSAARSRSSGRGRAEPSSLAGDRRNCSSAGDDPPRSHRLAPTTRSEKAGSFAALSPPNLSRRAWERLRSIVRRQQEGPMRGSPRERSPSWRPWQPGNRSVPRGPWGGDNVEVHPLRGSCNTRRDTKELRSCNRQHTCKPHSPGPLQKARRSEARGRRKPGCPSSHASSGGTLRATKAS